MKKALAVILCLSMAIFSVLSVSPRSALFGLALFVWELPQNFLGAIVFVGAHLAKIIKKIEFEKGRIFIQTDFSVSLGVFVFWTFDSKGLNKKHEYGHSIQSQILGPLYLIIVGLPSFCRVQYYDYYLDARDSRAYYQGFPENWADRLGWVDSRSRK